jgi:hypothetical protein
VVCVVFANIVNTELAAARRRNREVDRNGFFVDADDLAKGVDSSGVPLEFSPKLVAQTRKRESKWLDMMNNWDKWMRKKSSKVRIGASLSLGGSFARQLAPTIHTECEFIYAARRIALHVYMRAHPIAPNRTQSQPRCKI